MNKEYILKKISPYLTTRRQLREQDFHHLFALLSRRQQYKVVDILIDAGIDLVNDVNTGSATAEESGEQQKTNIVPLLDNSKLLNLTNEQLCLLYQQGNEIALDVLVEKNTRLIWSRALKFTGRYNHKLDDDDLYQYGLIGFIKAIQRFDIKKDARLTTYSIYWIDQSISRNIADFGFTIRLPVHYFEQANYVMRLFIKNPELSRDQIAEIAMEERDVSPSEFARLMNTIETIMSLASLNSFVGDQQDSELVEFIEDDTAPSVEDEVDLILLRKAISLALDTLKSREQLVISLRFGLRDGRRLTLEQIGKILGVTRESVRQIEQKAFRKLKHPSRSKDLQEFYYQG